MLELLWGSLPVLDTTGLGYQFDITKGNEVIFDFPGEHELSSYLIRAGLITDF